MDIIKFEILEDNDEVVKVEANQVHVRKTSGEYVIYTLKLDEENQVVDFNVFAITKGFGSIELAKGADLNDLSELWGSSDE
ncbi:MULTISPECIES: hypothetical protein [unclassified Modicisalibacter]|uniref:hypothetical protein n=1 Tax=unclassified Modicisalibacter TaxID=2679913 RepID=UPI001CCBCF2D|nr:MULTISPECIES: hypothetical protein [unclassified Modicisalibacter]MBZ9560491.1 hypothetical protein [Modicisalibacter sp. R2A 31.J]MBZ9575105.1 hypothetical protein [Modicisalibacter sp. MOD 31.J]